MALSEALVAKLAILGVSTLNSFIWALREAWLGKLVILDVLSSIFLILALHTYLLTTSFFTTSLSLLKSIGTGTNLSTPNLSNLVFKFLKLVGAFFNLSIAYSSTSSTNIDLSTPSVFFKSTFVA